MNRTSESVICFCKNVEICTNLAYIDRVTSKVVSKFVLNVVFYGQVHIGTGTQHCYLGHSDLLSDPQRF